MERTTASNTQRLWEHRRELVAKLETAHDEKRALWGTVLNSVIVNPLRLGLPSLPCAEADPGSEMVGPGLETLVPGSEILVSDLEMLDSSSEIIGVNSSSLGSTLDT